jgi:hypothetical protein
MDGQVSRISVDGLRSSDPTVLSVMIQDIINKPIDALSQQTLCDLLALSETEGLPRSLERELGRFREKMVREYNDIPDGEILLEHLERLARLEPGQVPACWRDAVLERQEVEKRCKQQLDALGQSFEETPPTPVSVASKPTVHVQRAHRPERRERPTTRRTATRGGSATPSRASSAAPRAPRTPVAQRDPRRAEWIREDIMDRLANYGSKGLKQAILVAGACHRSPWDNMGEEEVVAVLRTLAKENRVNFSAGRWSLRGRAW